MMVVRRWCPGEFDDFAGRKDSDCTPGHGRPVLWPFRDLVAAAQFGGGFRVSLKSAGANEGFAVPDLRGWSMQNGRALDDSRARRMGQIGGRAVDGGLSRRLSWQLRSFREGHGRPG